MDRVDSNTRLLPDYVCQEVIDRLDSEPKSTPNDLATEYAMRLIACYPDMRPPSPERYQVALIALLTTYPQSIARRVCDPVRGLASRLTKHPKIPDVKEALDVEMKRRDNIRAAALSNLQEKARRADQRKESEYWEHQRPSAEERAAHVDAVLKKFGFRQM